MPLLDWVEGWHWVTATPQALFWKCGTAVADNVKEHEVHSPGRRENLDILTAFTGNADDVHRGLTLRGA